MRQAERKPPSRPPIASSGGGAATLVRVIGITGRVLVGLGLLLLFYTVYLLWGTSVYTKQAQNDLARQLEAAPLLAQDSLSRGEEIPPAKPASEPKLGDPLFTISIPRIALRTVVVQGVGREELKKGPGHFPDCAAVPEGTDCVEGSPWPGEQGNVALSGHRTTFGAPFFNVNELQPGDVIDIESGPARYRYRVREQDGGIGHKIVSPSAIEVVEDHGTAELTLTTCHPRFSAAQRLVIHADYEGASFITPPDAGGGGSGELVDVAGDEPTLVPEAAPVVPADVVVLAAIAIAALIGAMALSDRLRPAAAWTTVVVLGGTGLWIAVFPQILQLMPANY